MCVLVYIICMVKMQQLLTTNVFQLYIKIVDFLSGIFSKDNTLQGGRVGLPLGGLSYKYPQIMLLETPHGLPRVVQG